MTRDTHYFVHVTRSLRKYVPGNTVVRTVDVLLVPVPGTTVLRTYSEGQARSAILALLFVQLHTNHLVFFVSPWVRPSFPLTVFVSPRCYDS